MFLVLFYIKFGRVVTKLGAGSDEIEVGMACSSHLVVSNLDFID